MTAGMTTEKVAISVPSQVLSAARRAVRAGRAPSLSAYISGVLAEQATRDDLGDLLDQLLAETGGPLTNAEVRAADEALGLGRGKRRGR
jgi:alkylhydroperoxidase/carboxymuconolactone decarboxylase family protein YurZ